MFNWDWLFPRKLKLPKCKPFNWYHDGPWYEHPIYKPWKDENEPRS